MIRLVRSMILAASLCVPAGAGVTALLAPSRAGAAEFTLRSRSLVQGPSRVAKVEGSSILLGTGCSLAVFGGGDLDEPGILHLEGEPRDIEASGTIAYVASFGEGLVTVDVSDPANPKKTGRVDIPQANRCALAGGALFVADGRGRLHTLSLDDPRSPRELESVAFTAAPVSLRGSKDILAVVFPQRTEIRRVEAGGATRAIAEIPSSAPVMKGILVEGVLCLLTLDRAVVSWDLGRPEAPRAMPPLDRSGIADIAARGSEGALLGGSRYVVPFRVEREAGSSSRPGAARIRLGKPATIPGSAGRAAREAPEGGGDAGRNAAMIFVGPGTIGTLAPFDGARIYSRRGSSLRETGSFETRGFALGVTAAGGLCYVANGFDGVRVGAVGASGAVEWIGHLRTEEARDVKLAGRYLAIADGVGGLKIADVSNPRSPRLVGSHASPFYICALAVDGGRVYCAGGLGGAEIVDVADPRRPRLVWRRDLSEVRGIDVDGSRMYVCDGDRGLRVFALDGAEPREVSVLDTPGWNCGVVAAGNLAYLADGGRGIVAADVSDPARPRAIGSAAVGSIARQLFLSEGTLFAAAFVGGIAAIDVSTPERPLVSASYPAVNDGRCVFADERFVYLASGSGGLYVLSFER